MCIRDCWLTWANRELSFEKATNVATRLGIAALATSCELRSASTASPRIVQRTYNFMSGYRRPPLLLMSPGSDDMAARRSASSARANEAYSKNSSSTFLTYRVSSMRRPTPWRIIKRVSWSPSISTIRLLRSSAVSRADEEKAEAYEQSLSGLEAVKAAEKVANGASANDITIGIAFGLHKIRSRLSAS
jgi:hypothetical protein